jgi:hypothetical protein
VSLRRHAMASGQGVGLGPAVEVESERVWRSPERCSLRPRKERFPREVTTATLEMLEGRVRRGGRAVEGTGLENRQRRKSLVGSNPTPSASESAMLSILRRTARNRRVCGAWWFQSPPEIYPRLRFRRRSPGFSPFLISAVDFGILSTNLSAAGWAHNRARRPNASTLRRIRTGNGARNDQAGKGKPSTLCWASQASGSSVLSLSND